MNYIFDWRNNPLNCGCYYLRYVSGHVYIFHLKKKCDEVIFYNWTHVVCFASYNSDASVANYELLLAVWGTNLWCFTDSKVTGKSIAFSHSYFLAIIWQNWTRPTLNLCYSFLEMVPNIMKTYANTFWVIEFCNGPPFLNNDFHERPTIIVW